MENLNLYLSSHPLKPFCKLVAAVVVDAVVVVVVKQENALSLIAKDTQHNLEDFI